MCETHLVAAALTPGQLRYGDSDEDHKEAGGEVLLVRLVLRSGGLSQGGQQVGVHLAGVPTGAGQLRHQAGLVRRPGMAVEVLDGGGEEGDSLLQLVGQRVLQEFSEAEDDACRETSGEKYSQHHPVITTDNCHPLEDTVNVLKPFEQLLHDVRLVKVGPEGDQDLFVEEDQLPQLRHLALDVPHQGLVEEFYPIRSCTEELASIQPS